MQQPMPPQHDQISSQQAMAQQMVLCPVRFVYETQILVQPGDQIQPNQTFFINPQNPPPWMQNSLQSRQAMQSPVVYVQQLPNNLVPSVQQPIDQNQLYLQQNFTNFQIPQQMLTQNPQEMRQTMQLANIVPNIVQNIQTSAPNERTVQQNTQIHNNQMIQNQINRQTQNQIVNQPVEVQRQVYMRPQMHQQANIQRPVMQINQMPNIQQQSLVSMPNVAQGNIGQTFIPNIGRPPNVNNVRPSNNVVNVQSVAKVRNTTPQDVNRTVNSPVGNVVPSVRSSVPNNYYRPIQPRPQSPQVGQNQNMANMPKIQPHIPVQTIPNNPMTFVGGFYRDNSAIIQQLNNPTVNKKRKSESPDDIQKKMAVIPKPYPTQQLTVSKLVNEIGTNTSPVHKPKIQIQYENTQVNKIIDNLEEKPQDPVASVDKDKLVRNTVYPQARGRVLQAKVDEIKPLEKPIETTKPIEDKPIRLELQTNMEINLKPQVQQVVHITENEKIVTKIETVHKEDEKVHPVVVKEEVIEIAAVNKVADNEIVDIKKVEKEVKNDIDKKPLESNRLTIKQENLNILTHVVDGYVIQESNFAFPIRKPLKEKTLQSNKSQEAAKIDVVRESIKEELKNNVDIPLLPFHYLLLDSAREEKEKMELAEKEEERERNNPFSRLQHPTVKSWTVDDLSSYLLKFNWKETVSLLQDHEIDGETLYLVSKPQLLTIGVSEEHADVICEFVKS